ncbi:hypothetical protein TMM008_20120 [Pseudomonas sp. 008]|nr:hypothetical protein TMM008_20120 [Pseudomonas sp. 008]
MDEGELFKKLIEFKWLPPSNYYHLKSGGHVDAIKYHLDGQFFIHADLKKFFNSINRSRITRELKPYFGYEKARSIAMESTVSIPLESGQVFALPFGFVQSTIIASLCLRKSRLGKTIHKLDSTEGIKASVYVDDIIISTQSMEKANLALSMIQESSKKSGLLLNKEKLKGPAESITAFNIDLSPNLVMISNTRFRELLANYRNSTSDNQKNGIFGYVYSVNPAQAAILTSP